MRRRDQWSQTAMDERRAVRASGPATGGAGRRYRVQTIHPLPPRVRSDHTLLGVFFLFSGAAVLGHILWGLPFRILLLLTTGLLVAAVVVTLLRSDPRGRRRIKRLWIGGLVSGLLATGAYDVAKFGLSRLDPQPFDPFGAIPIFGEMIIGPDASPAGLITAGIAVHVLNGAAFGIAYAFLFSRRGLGTGVAWGLLLETFQLILYPGWLGIDTFREFVTVSAGGHLVYGAVLGTVAHRLIESERYVGSARSVGSYE